MKLRTFILLLLLSTSVRAQIPYDNMSLRFRKHQVNDGLSENTVFCIFQSRGGFIWLGTKDGLNRFDGISYKTYRSDNTDRTLGNCFIRSMAEDKEGTLWLGTDLGVYRMDPVKETFSHFNLTTEKKSIITRAVHSILVDSRGRVWMATNEGIFMYEEGKSHLKHFYPGNGAYDIPSRVCWKVYEDRSGSIWGGTREGLVKYDEQNGVMIDYTDPSTKNVGEDEILTIHEDTNGNFWLGTWSGGLKRLDRATKKFRSAFSTGSRQGVSHIRTLLDYDDRSLLVGSDDGLFRVDKFDWEITRLDHRGIAEGLSDKTVYCSYRDREGGLWIGTRFSGANYLISNSIWLFSPNLTDNSLSGRAVSQFCEDEQHNLWIATEDGGLNYFNTRTNTFDNDKVPRNISYYNLHALLIDGEDLWIGTFSRGIDVYNRRTGQIVNLRHDSNSPKSLSDDCVFSLYRDPRGNIYAGTTAALDLYDRKTREFTTVLDVKGSYILDIEADTRGNLWVATSGSGLYRRDSSGKWSNYRRDSRACTDSIAHNKVTGIFIDDQKRLWLSTEGGGISLYNYEGDNFTTYTDRDGIANNVVYNIQQDQLGHLWLSTNRGITRFSPGKPEATLYFTQHDGLQSNEFNYRSGFRASDGRIFFGGIDGFNAFYPDKLDSNPVSPEVAITSVKLLNDSSGKELSGERIVLPHDMGSMTISFASLSFKSPKKNIYQYILEGADREWNQPTSHNNVTYLNLRPGEYTFRMKGSNNDGIWSEKEASLRIVIKPPFWLTTCAKLLYTVITITLVYLLFKRYNRRSRIQTRQKIEEIRNSEEKRSLDSKISFFTSVTHEIRTPVSLIKAPLEAIISSGEGSEETRENLRIIERNSNRLIELINQLMDFRKLDSDHYKLRYQYVDLYDFLKQVVGQFSPAAKDKNVAVFFEAMPEARKMILSDKDALSKIVNNLMSNALKFTEDTIWLKLGCDAEEYFISVSDNGKGIPDDMKTKVFEPFVQGDFQNNLGTGIGLSLAKLMAERLDGTLIAEDHPPHGTVFTFRFASYSSRADRPEASLEAETPSPGEEASEGKEHTLLFVDDNEEILHFIKLNLGNQYNILTAVNAEEGLKLMKSRMPDVVVLDIMMPGTDGLALTRMIREDSEICHLPVILLSAKSMIDTKVEGLEQGADVFIEKPFSLAHLRAQINSLIARRDGLYASFSSAPVSLYSTLVKNGNDRDLIEKINAEIEKGLSDSNFNVEMLADELGFSRSNLQRKFKSVSGMTPNDYLRTYRLKRAAQLLADEIYRVNEVCYLVGFSSPSYFAKCFSKQFGVLPKDYRK